MESPAQWEVFDKHAWLECYDRWTGAARRSRRTEPEPARQLVAGGRWSLATETDHYASAMLIIGIILFGMLVGAGAQLLLGGTAGGIDWAMAIVSGLVGSVVGGLLISLLAGDGLELRPSGIIGSLAGAVLVTLAWQLSRRSRTT